MLLLVLTILKLNLYFQVLSQQVHNHGLHVTTDATAIPVGGQKQFGLTMKNNAAVYSLVIQAESRSTNLWNRRSRHQTKQTTDIKKSIPVLQIKKLFCSIRHYGSQGVNPCDQYVMLWIALRQRVSYSLLYQLNDALCVHEEDFSLWLLVESSSVAVQDVCNLKTRGINHTSI